MIQYGGQGVSVARQYYLARKRSDETPPEYLHRLNVAATHAKIAIKEEREAMSAKRREHGGHAGRSRSGKTADLTAIDGY